VSRLDPASTPSKARILTEVGVLLAVESYRSGLDFRTVAMVRTVTYHRDDLVVESPSASRLTIEAKGQGSSRLTPTDMAGSSPAARRKVTLDAPSYGPPGSSHGGIQPESLYRATMSI
jgi:hypothetical protein